MPVGILSERDIARCDPPRRAPARHTQGLAHDPRPGDL
jgi:hypothetical protein